MTKRSYASTTSGNAANKKRQAPQRRIVRRYHPFVFSVLRPLCDLLMRLVFSHKAQRYTPPIDGPFLILANHTTPQDPIFLGTCFRFPIYYITSDHIFKWGFVSKLIRFLVAPIPIVKSQTDTQALRSLIAVRDQGGSIGLFPEGNTSFSGQTGHIPESTAKLCKLLNMPVLLARIEGGYFSVPRWSSRNRKGRITSYVYKLLRAEEIQSMSLMEIQSEIQSCLSLNAFSSQREHPVPFLGKQLSEWLELTLFVCPNCRSPHDMYSRDDSFICRCCDFSVRYLPTGFFELLASHSWPQDTGALDTVLAWYEWQRNALIDGINAGNMFDLTGSTPIFSDDSQFLYLAARAAKNSLLTKGLFTLYADRLEFAGQYVFPMDKILKMSMHGKMTLQFTTADGKAYEICTKHMRSAFRYMALYYLLQSRRRGETLGFLGL